MYLTYDLLLFLFIKTDQIRGLEPELAGFKSWSGLLPKSKTPPNNEFCLLGRLKFGLVKEQKYRTTSINARWFLLLLVLVPHLVVMVKLPLTPRG